MSTKPDVSNALSVSLDAEVLEVLRVFSSRSDVAAVCECVACRRVRKVGELVKRYEARLSAVRHGSMGAAWLHADCRLQWGDESPAEQGFYEGYEAAQAAAIPCKFKIGDPVAKITGYTVYGEVRGIFTTTNGDVRLVVEHKAEGGGSFCHIYNESQLGPDTRTKFKPGDKQVQTNTTVKGVDDES